MGKKLWGGEVIGEDTPGLKRSRKNKQKVSQNFVNFKKFRFLILRIKIILINPP